MTDKLTGTELVEKAFVYMTSLAKEYRKAVTTKFEREHKGIPFESAEAVIRKETEAWFNARDKNIRLNLEKSSIGKPGEILVNYSGTTKDAHFKMCVDGLFTLAGSSSKAPSYLKRLNLNIDKRDFTK